MIPYVLPYMSSRIPSGKASRRIRQEPMAKQIPNIQTPQIVRHEQKIEFLEGPGIFACIYLAKAGYTGGAIASIAVSFSPIIINAFKGLRQKSNQSEKTQKGQ